MGRILVRRDFQQGWKNLSVIAFWLIKPREANRLSFWCYRLVTALQKIAKSESCHDGIHLSPKYVIIMREPSANQIMFRFFWYLMVLDLGQIFCLEARFMNCEMYLWYVLWILWRWHLGVRWFRYMVKPWLHRLQYKFRVISVQYSRMFLQFRPFRIW